MTAHNSWRWHKSCPVLSQQFLSLGLICSMCWLSHITSIHIFVVCIQLTCSHENKRYTELVEQAVKFKLQFENADLIAGGHFLWKLYTSKIRTFWLVKIYWLHKNKTSEHSNRDPRICTVNILVPQKFHILKRLRTSAQTCTCTSGKSVLKIPSFSVSYVDYNYAPFKKITIWTKHRPPIYFLHSLDYMSCHS